MLNIYNNPEIFLTQEPFSWNRTSYETVTSVDSKNTVYLASHKGNDAEENSDLLITGPNGGYISSGYIIKTDIVAGVHTRQWVVNPFEFFRTALATDDLPKPDTTTIAGRRIYYSHIDGDGYNSITQLEEYRDQGVLSAQVVMDKAIKPHPELPVTLTVIAGDIDPAWAATQKSREIAKELFALPQVEAGTHTYSHPFNWEFFEDENKEKEIPYLRLYPQNAKQTVWNPDSEAKKTQTIFSKFVNEKLRPKAMPDGNARPRAFAHEPFNIQKEVQGSIMAIEEVLPKDKQVEVIMWSGDCMPWEEVLHQSRLAGVQNINGGDTLFDARHPNYATVAAIGRQVGKELQIYASTSNEIPYTNEWTENFDAHRHLQETLRNTESPIRLKPLNIYYHLYAGEKEAGLNALLSNINYATAQSIAPITTSHYTHIAEGFYDTKFLQVAPDTWTIKNRGALQTIRFDKSSFKSVDFGRSKGVIGQNYLQGSLYVYLDETVSKPIIALKNNPNYFDVPKENVPYLIESRWLISNLRSSENYVDFTAQGFGDGDCTWQVPVDGNYRVRINGNDTKIVVAKDRKLKMQIEQNATQPLHLTITRIIQYLGYCNAYACYISCHDGVSVGIACLQHVCLPRYIDKHSHD